jgi:hypothetical protein
MRLRAWIGSVAAITVSWHGVLLACHSVAMADALRHHRAFLSDMTSLCRTRPGETSNVATDLPPMPLPSAPRPDDAAGCLVCAGLVGAVLPTPQSETLSALATPAVGSAEAGAQRVSPSQIAHPPARGPPRAA